jgi:stage II sporulation protein Q
MREEEKKRTSQNSSLQRFFKKRWVFPAIYLASAAIILTGVLWFQSANNDVADNGLDINEELPGTANNGEPAVPVNTTVENFAMPVLDEDAVEIQRQFYDADGSKEEQEAALVSYENTYYPNKGIDIVAKDGKSFDVTASLSGTVVRSEQDSLFGNIVEIEHSEGVVTVYHSLADVMVEQGDRVDQGQVIAKAGKNLFNKDADIHVHFEIRNNGLAVNPIEFFDQPLTSLEQEESASEQPADPADEAEETEDADETEAPADDDKSEQDENTDASIGMATV